jgi:uncharacterized protein (TIGR02172 family)
MPELSSPLAVGRTAEIFAWGEGQVLKLIRPGFYMGLADQEWNNCQTAWQLGAPAPKPIELIEVNGRRGVVLERVQGPTLTRTMQKYPWRLASHARLLARQQAALHTLRVPGFPSLVERARNNISRTSLFSPEMKERLMAMLATLPEGDRICHGDFHPENILLADRGPVVIDWEGSMRGDPSADVAVTRMFLRIFSTFGTGGRGWVLRQYLQAFERVYLAEYRRVAEIPVQDQTAWIAVVTAMRLDDDAAPFLPRLMPLIEQGLIG